MKTAIYIDDGSLQIVLTPETKFETALLKGAEEYSTDCYVRPGQFYDCQGGWTREGSSDKQSLIVRMRAIKGN